jgi:hypothetical protein
MDVIEEQTNKMEITEEQKNKMATFWVKGFQVLDLFLPNQTQDTFNIIFMGGGSAAQFCIKCMIHTDF